MTAILATVVSVIMVNRLCRVRRGGRSWSDRFMIIVVRRQNDWLEGDRPAVVVAIWLVDLRR